MIGLNAIGFLQAPDPPYYGFQFRKLAKELCDMELPYLCTKFNSNHHRYDRSSQGCNGIKKDLEAKLKGLEQQIYGFKLKGYKNLPKAGSVP